MSDLRFWLNAIATTERSLLSHRANLISSAREAGINPSEALAETEFVPRREAAAWRGTLRAASSIARDHEEISEEADVNARALELVNSGRRARNLPLLTRSQFITLGSQKAPGQVENNPAETEELDPDDARRPGEKKRKKKTKATDDEEAETDDVTKPDHEDAPGARASWADRGFTAEAVIRAGKKRRGEL